jgi:hypothetical protein
VKESFSLNAKQLFQFVLFTFLTCPPNFLWQEFIEEKFPGQIVQADGSKTLHKYNTAKKFALDQTIGALVNTAIFIGTFAAFKGKDSKAIQRDVRKVGWRFSLNWFEALTQCTGNVTSDGERLETLASCVDTELHRGTGTQAHLGWKCGRLVLGNLSEFPCSVLTELETPKPSARLTYMEPFYADHERHNILSQTRPVLLECRPHPLRSGPI